ncbi:hypothetical protein [Neptuniibacter caesariensis]|uniref:Uncharacterized protein n=1 Tax=Neptuniibacter caesariensis TaxID=207954 RepID=A0A7U8GT89_NEPCE|nr:hypothetical protein [Neptuniibacter caesariensis]EAR62047.1 hypothetical protein MED92_10089 [Oceanospirillum sp. MED92] [Neptuniibacter caesariensis]
MNKLSALFPEHKIQSIYSAASSSVWHSHAIAHSETNGKPREEDFVCSLVTDGINKLADSWAEILDQHGISIRISGVFVHGHPQVTWTGIPNKSKVELADLLVIHQHVGKKKAFSRAILVQAKMSADITLKLKPTDSQLELFSLWPRFKFETGGLDKRWRDFGDNRKGSRYSLISPCFQYPEDIRWPDQCPWAASLPKVELTCDSSFSKLLGDILLGKDGRPFSLLNPRNDWSKTIVELLKITANKTYKRTKMGRIDIPRGNIAPDALAGCLFYANPTNDFQLKNNNQKFDQFFDHCIEIEMPPNEPSFENQDDDFGGLSTLIIETSDTEAGSKGD